MTDLLKEPKPSNAAIEYASFWMNGPELGEVLERAYAIDVAPLIARNAELEAEGKRLSLAVGASVNEIGRLRAEIERLREGLSGIVNCQSGVGRAAMREAAADVLRKTGKIADQCDQSPFVASLFEARAEVGRLTNENERLTDENNAHHSGDSVIIQNYFDLGRELGLPYKRASTFKAVIDLRNDHAAAKAEIERLMKERDGVIERAYNDGYGDGKIRAARLCRGFLVGDPANGVPLRNPTPHEIEAHIRKHLTPADMKSAEARAELLERRVAELERKCRARHAHTFDDVIDVSKQLLKRASYYQEYCLDDAVLLEEAAQMLDEMAADWSEERERADKFLARSETAERQNAALVEANARAMVVIKETRDLVSKCALEGFNHKHAPIDELFANNAALTNVLAQLDAPQPDARDATIAALGRALRPFSAGSSTADDIMQARRLLAQFDVPRPSEAARARCDDDGVYYPETELDAPQPTERPVTDEEVEDAINLYDVVVIDGSQELAMRAALEAFIKNRSGSGR
jgi:hypothetical protein